MTTKSPLRQLAREYYEGHIGRADYTVQRKHLLAELVDASDTVTAPQVQPEISSSELFDTLGEEQPDSMDLANALANRVTDTPPGDELIPDLSAPRPEDPAPEYNPALAPAEKRGQVGSRKPRIWLRLLVLLLLLLCSGAAGVLLYLQR